MPHHDDSVPRAAHVLVVTGHAATGDKLTSLLARNRFCVTQVGGKTPLQPLLRCGRFDLLIIDTRLSGQDHVALCRSLRATSNVAIVLVVESHDDAIAIEGLEAGADAYVLRGGRPRETLARLRSVLRRTLKPALENEDLMPMRFDGWRLDPRLRTLQDPTGKMVSLTAAEFDLLVALARNAGSVLSRRTLLASARFGVAGPVERSVDVHIARLRGKIEADPRDPAFVKTVRLGGYVFAATVVFE